MSTNAQIIANQTNAQASTGPRTEEGKESSSRNATTHGLFTTRDFVRPEEREEYAAHCAAMRAELNPAGPLEETFAEAIIGASWRLRRCAAIEARMAETNPGLDPMEADDATRRLQLSVDRARAQAHNVLRRSLAELRRLQTERQIRTALFEDAEAPPAPDLTSYDAVSKALDRHDRAQTRNRTHAQPLAELASFCNGAPQPFGSEQVAQA